MRNIAFAPFALTVEKWRWNVFDNRTRPENYNMDWWKLRCKYQGLGKNRMLKKENKKVYFSSFYSVPPVERTSSDFDPGSKYHIAASVPYDRYFVSLILTFQFHDALCRASNHTGPLHKCDIYNSKKAGEKLKELMKKGSSVPWPQVLKEFTDGKSDRIDPKPMLDYFAPLVKWLKQQNLTDTNWDCDSYVNDRTQSFMAYDHKRQQLAVKNLRLIYEKSSSNKINKADYFSFILMLFFYSFYIN